MLATAGAMHDVDIRHAFIAIRLRRIPRLDLVVFRVPAAMGDLLVLLQRLEILDRQQVPQLGRRPALTGEIVAHASAASCR